MAVLEVNVISVEADNAPIFNVLIESYETDKI